MPFGPEQFKKFEEAYRNKAKLEHCKIGSKNGSKFSEHCKIGPSLDWF